MKNKFIVAYGIFAFIILLGTVLWFVFSVSAEKDRGSLEAEQSNKWLSRETAALALSDGFMSDGFIQKLTTMCQGSTKLSALVIMTPSGAVFAWPSRSESLQYDLSGKPQIKNTSMFMKSFSTTLDIGDSQSGSVVLDSAIYILLPDAIFSASRNSFLVVFTLVLLTFIFILFDFPAKKQSVKATPFIVTPSDDIDDSAVSLSDIEMTNLDADDIDPYEHDSPGTISETAGETVAETQSANGNHTSPEGLFSPLTGIGWEQYLADRLDAELIRAASSEQDLSLIIIQVTGLLHTDLLSKKIAKVLLDTFKFRDLVFEFGTSGFAGILQNINLDQAMKIADELYAGIDSILMELAYSGRITIGITTRTARLLPASRMIEEAVSAVKKAVEEPSLPIVAFRANPEKYRSFVAENT